MSGKLGQAHAERCLAAAHYAPVAQRADAPSVRTAPASLRTGRGTASRFPTLPGSGGNRTGLEATPASLHALAVENPTVLAGLQVEQGNNERPLVVRQ